MGLRWVLIALALATTMGSVLFKGYEMFTGGEEPILTGIDDTFYYIWLRSAVMDRDLDFANDLELTRSIAPSHRENVLRDDRTETGLVANKYWIGWPLVNAIVYVPTALLVTAFDSAETITGFEPVFLITLWGFQILLGFFSLRFSWDLISRYTSREAALLGLLLTWLASPLIYYQTARVSLVHNQVFFLVVTITLLTFRIVDRRAGTGTWLLIGLLSGLAVVTRPTTVVYLLFPIVVMVMDLGSTDRRLWIKRTVLAVAIGSLPLLVQVAAWKVVFGHFVVYSYAGEAFTFGSPKILAVLFSDYHGWLNWHPFLMIGFTFFGINALRARDLRVTWVISSLLIIWVNASWWCYWFGSSFGNRSFEGLTLFAMLGTALLLDRPSTSRLRRSVIALGFIAIAWNLQSLGGWFIHAYPREAPVSYQDRIIRFPVQPDPESIEPESNS